MIEKILLPRHPARFHSFAPIVLQKLKLTHFKNYLAQEIQFSGQLNCFVGLNGMGKTNLLDAVYFLCLCKTHASLPDRNLVQHGAAFFRLEGWFEREGLGEKVVAKFQPGQRKEFERNGVPVPRLADHIGQFPVVMIAPDDISLVQDGSEERRRFVDTTLSQISPEYISNLLVYNNLLKQRNALLKKFADEKRFDADLLEAIDRQMPGPAQVVFERRRAFVAEFRPVFLEMYAAISGGRETPSVEYESDLEKDGLEVLLETTRERDRALQRTGSGVHRDDLRLFLDEQPLKKFASQGQLKSFLLALRLAQFEVLRHDTGRTPILLLDDIFDKLDEARVRQLVALLLARQFGQIFITDTQRNRIESVVSSFPAEYRIFEVTDGRILNDE